MTYTITLNDSRAERITAAGIQLSPDGSLVFMNGAPNGPQEIVMIVNSRSWHKVEPSAIQATH